MRVAQWARLQTPARCGLRWGAWYPVMGLTAREARLWVRGRTLAVARSLLELRNTPPREWTVARTKDASDPYLVCRLLLEKKKLLDGRVATLRCPRYNELFTTAPDDPASHPRTPATNVQPSNELKHAHRVRRLRIPRDSRSGDDR